MNESVAPARRLALRLGDDLDRLLESPDLETTQPEVVVSPPANAALELRQVAGLTAGSSMPLGIGAYQFGPSDHGRGLDLGDPTDVGFTVAVSEDQTVTLHPSPETRQAVRVDGVHIFEPTVIELDQVIDAGSARFQLAPKRAIQRRRRTLQRVDRAMALFEPDVPTPTIEEIAAIQEAHPRRRNRSPISRLSRKEVLAEDPVAQHFVSVLRAHRAEVMANRRLTHPDPEALLHQARHAADLAWDCDRTHHAFAEVAIAYGDEPWQPRFSHPERVPDGASTALQELFLAPSVPQIADLRRGPLGIVGDRNSTLAVARQILVTVAVRSAPEDVALMVMADEEREADWAWAAHAPHAQQRFEGALPIVFVDDVDQLDGDLADPLLEAGGFGTILLSETVDELPPICPTVMTIDAHGGATVVQHENHTTVIGATPIGLSPELAASAMSSLVKAPPMLR